MNNKFTLRADRYELPRQDILWLHTWLPLQPNGRLAGTYCALGHLHRTLTWREQREWLRYELAGFWLLVPGQWRGVELCTLHPLGLRNCYE